MKDQDKRYFGLSKNVFFTGLVSFFMDVSSEMIYPLVPLFLANQERGGYKLVYTDAANMFTDPWALDGGLNAYGSLGIHVTADGQPATILYSGVQPQYPGLDQINVRLSKAARPSMVEITAVSTGQTVRYELPPL